MDGRFWGDNLTVWSEMEFVYAGLRSTVAAADLNDSHSHWQLRVRGFFLLPSYTLITRFFGPSTPSHMHANFWFIIISPTNVTSSLHRLIV